PGRAARTRDSSRPARALRARADDGTLRRASDARMAALREPLVADPMRLRRVLALAPLQILGVVGVVALEVDDLAVALEREDVRRDAVEEPAVVRDHDGAAREVQQR